ncbi:MAG: hypothetical protein H6834_08820 [Planctomycetes bacterium]|nr:hypothetical protein [Planctomycetota bacterium]
MTNSTPDKEPTRRDVLTNVARGAVFLGVAGTAAHLILRSGAQGAWWIDSQRCVNSRLGATTLPACQRCSTECVKPLSAVRAVNEFSQCGRCYICPAYFDVTSAVDEKGLPSEKRCPRDAIQRTPIGWVDPDDPANNFYEYEIDELRCNGCGLCVMGCKEPAGLGSMTLQVRHDLCVDCNRCSIANACPDDAYAYLSLPTKD